MKYYAHIEPFNADSFPDLTFDSLSNKIIERIILTPGFIDTLRGMTEFKWIGDEEHDTRF